MKKLLLILVLVVICSSVARAGYFNPGLELVKKENYVTALSLLFFPLATSNDAWEAANKGDYVTALKLWQPLAEQGDVRAQSILSGMYFIGQGVTQNFQEAAKWMLKAAKQGNADAQTLLGRMYQEGQGVTQNSQEAAKWMLKAAKQGNADAQFALALMYGNGKDGVNQDYKEAVRYYRLAAEQGHGNAQYNLGVMYRDGQGVLQDYKETKKWWLLAAKQENELAQYGLGRMHLNVYSGVFDIVQAHMWMNIAASNGRKEAAKARDSIAKLMLPAKLSEARDMAKKCLESNYKNCDLSYKNGSPESKGIEFEKEKERKIKEQDVRVAAEIERLQKELREEEERRRLQKLSYAQAVAKRSVIDEFKAKILAKIKTKLVLPPDLPNDPVAEFDVALFSDGEISSVKLRNSSGFRSFDKAVERAIILARPLPLPKDKSLFSNFRNLNLKVRK